MTNTVIIVSDPCNVGQLLSNSDGVGGGSGAPFFPLLSQ